MVQWLNVKGFFACIHKTFSKTQSASTATCTVHFSSVDRNPPPRSFLRVPSPVRPECSPPSSPPSVRSHVNRDERHGLYSRPGLCSTNSPRGRCHVSSQKGPPPVPSSQDWWLASMGIYRPCVSVCLFMSAGLLLASVRSVNICRCCLSHIPPTPFTHTPIRFGLDVVVGQLVIMMWIICVCVCAHT